MLALCKGVLTQGAFAGVMLFAMSSCSPKSEAAKEAQVKAEPARSEAATKLSTVPVESKDAPAGPFVVQSSPGMASRSVEARATVMPGRTAKAGEELQRQNLKAEQVMQAAPVMINKQNRELIDALTVKPR